MTAREWLSANDYDEVVALIDRVMNIWKRAGRNTRRNWWGILAGTKDGGSRKVEGIIFPVLATAQRHECVPVTKNAVQKSRKEQPPPKSYRGISIRKRTA